MNRKNNKALQNLLPEAIGRLSAQEDFSVGQFKLFAENFMKYLEEDKYSEALVSKLCARIKGA